LHAEHSNLTLLTRGAKALIGFFEYVRLGKACLGREVEACQNFCSFEGGAVTGYTLAGSRKVEAIFTGIGFTSSNKLVDEACFELPEALFFVP
jgi:hypothetical protein